MTVRDARPDDAEAVRRVHRASIEGLGRGSYDDEQVEAWAAGCETADYATRIESADVPFLVAEDGDEVVGFGSLSFDPPEQYGPTVDAEVTAVYVRPSAAREGVGTALLLALERRARERGVETVALSSSLNAVPFYERHGYEQVLTYAHEFSSDLGTGVEGEVVAMEKELE